MLRTMNFLKFRLPVKKFKYIRFRSYATKTEQVLPPNRLKTIGQPTHHTHPYLLRHDEITPMLTRDEFRQRRQNVMESIARYNCHASAARNFMLIQPAASKKYMSDKIPYVFRQNTEFLYLTGCQEPDSCLVLISNGSGKFSSVLFTQGRDVHSELWDGPRICPSSVNELFGISQGLPMKELENYINSHIKSEPGLQIWYDLLNPTQNDVQNIMHNLLKGCKNSGLENPKIIIDQQRMIKSEAEIQLMRKTCNVASEAIIKTIETSCPGMNEHELFAKVDYECRIRGAEYLAYPPVVAGGKRANIIHYITNNQIVNDKEMVLMDAGCECHGYSSDVTRTWPIGGRFTNEQKELYQAVLETQIEIIEMCNKFPSLDSLFESMCRILGGKLQEIGLIDKSLTKEALFKAAYGFCPHHVSHYLGMDVHDTPSITRNIQMRPGMVITVEPGIYISENNVKVPPEYRGIGIRIEDDVLITDNGPEVLTINCPKDVGHIEEIASKNL